MNRLYCFVKDADAFLEPDEDMDDDLGYNQNTMRTDKKKPGVAIHLLKNIFCRKVRT